mmetsp:Transcript_107748/g.347862  ORF Transcript_107748/g.347862 Transcript_107748/m.347862 type:complete len:218 (+) Transcript_107748:514-1167(+)
MFLPQSPWRCCHRWSATSSLTSSSPPPSQASASSTSPSRVRRPRPRRSSRGTAARACSTSRTRARPTATLPASSASWAMWSRGATTGGGPGRPPSCPARPGPRSLGRRRRRPGLTATTSCCGWQSARLPCRPRSTAPCAGRSGACERATPALRTGPAPAGGLWWCPMRRGLDGIGAPERPGPALDLRPPGCCRLRCGRRPAAPSPPAPRRPPWPRRG